MERFSAAVENRIVRALGAYLRATPSRELPVSVRRFQAFGAKALMPHRDKLIEALEDAPLRARIVGWLDDGKTPLKRPEVELLRTIAERKDGWAEAVRAQGSKSASRPSRSSAAVPDRLERERDKARRAREELQRIKAEASSAQRRSRADIADRDRKIADLERRLAAAEASANATARELQELRRSVERSKRKEGRDRGKAATERDKLQGEARAAKREARELRSAVAKLEREVATREARAARRAPSTARAARAARTPLAVPKGRLADAPETLEEWLAAPRVHLLVDGYNVTKAKGGFGDLRLESQRERLIDEIGRLARKKAVPATIVFDGADLPPGAGRRSRKRSPVAVEYSRPPEVGDDHLVAKLGSMPNDPVVVVTNDRELQGRVRELGGTVATSDQLLVLIR